MKTASELISFLVKDKHFSLCSVCELHKPCATTPRCSWEPAKRGSPDKPGGIKHIAL